MLRILMTLAIMALPSGVLAEEGSIELCLDFQPLPPASDFDAEEIADMANLHMEQDPDMDAAEAMDRAAITMMGFRILEQLEERAERGELSPTPLVQMPDGSWSANCGSTS